MDAQLENVRHDYIRYSNCWEDADLLLLGLDIAEGDRVLSIGSAGDNSFSLLTGKAEIVVAIDINDAQIALIHLKKAAFIALNHASFLQFLGFRKCDDRKSFYLQIKNHLPHKYQIFWNNRIQKIEKGIIHTGKFEQYFSTFRKYILPLIHSSKTVDQLFEQKPEQAQAEFYKKVWDNRRWRFFFTLFFNKFTMGKFGRDPSFFNEVNTSVHKYIFSQARRHLKSIHCQKNYLLHYIFNGNYVRELPHYARKRNFQLIKQNINRLEIQKGFVETAFQSHKDFNKFNLSDIFEYMDEKKFHDVGSTIIENSSTGSRYMYWNLMVHRNLDKISDDVNTLTQCVESKKELDKGFFYTSVLINEKA